MQRNSYSDKSFMSSSLGHVPNDNYLSEVWSKKDDRKELRDELLDVNLSPVVGSADAPRKLVGFPAKHLNDPRRTLFNPFKPLNIPCRWTCNRHRWAHSFPKGQDGIVIHRQFLKHSKRVPRVAQRDDEMSNNKELESDCTTQDKQYKMQEKLTLKRRKGHIRTKAHHHLDAIEQDWTAEVETSVDWKSLILPACLPLTSEYCPDMKTLDTGYLEFHYELCIGDDDDSCGNEFMVSKPRSSSNPPRYDDQINSHPVSVSSMITELVAQRLSKGFQILTDPPHQERPTFSTFMSTDHDFEAEEYFLSIGRNIHRLSVVPKQSQINVTRYRPRHIRGLEPINYWYQLHIGRTLSSNLQETEFQHDELDKYNWNYLDQHISGIQDFAEMVESLRYWKSRFLLLPMTHRKKPSGDNNGSVDESAYIEGMIKYLEALNGIKGSKVPRRPTSPLVSHKTSLLKPYNTHDKHIPNVADNKMESKDAEAQGRAHGNKSLGDSTSCDIKNNSLETSHVSVDDILTANSPLERIVEDIMDTLSGFSFLPTTKGLQPYSFISIHCVEWMMRSVKGLNGRRDCMMLAQKMVDAKIIQHASGNPNQQFVYGFVIFYITSKDNWKTSKETTSNNLEAPYASMMFEDFHQKFQEDWFEVIFDCTHTMPSFLASDEEILQYYESYPDIKHVPFGKRGRAKSTSQIPHQQDCAIGPAYKTVHINCDLQRKSNRNEFAIIRYHGNYCNSHAFEFEVHWIEATGSIVHDLVQGWARKASSCGFHLVPVPVSPFPDRLGNNMDPLRLPVFIPVDVTVIQDVLKSFESSVYQLRVFLFLEAILSKFEFLKDSPCRRLLDKPYIMTPPVQCRANYYIHTSGVACAHIIDQDSAAELRTERVGYYWTKNFILTKKWRSSSTGDGEFASKLLTDFRQFCSNACGSLEAFCESLQEKSEESVSTH